MAEKKKRFRLFDSQREGKGVSKEEANLPPNLKKFWILYRDNFFGRLVSVNLMMIIGNFPVIFLIMAIAGVGQAEYTSPSDHLFSIFQGVSSGTEGISLSQLALLGMGGLQIASHANTFWSYLLWGLGALTIFTWGLVSVGVAYILRNIASGRPVFLLSDFFDAIRNNFKQAFVFGIIDFLIFCIIPYNIYNMLRMGDGYLTSVLFWSNIVLFLAYLMMRWYVYLQIVSFDMKLFKMIKNALYFILLGFKRNLLALLGTALMVAVCIFFLFSFGGRLIVITLFIPGLMLFSNSAFMHIFAAWHKIDEIMVIKAEDPEEDEEPIEE